jgi:hypothetical protein
MELDQREAIAKECGGITDLPHSRRSVHISLDARQNGAVVHQKNAVLLPTAALQVSVFISMNGNGPHFVL